MRRTWGAGICAAALIAIPVGAKGAGLTVVPVTAAPAWSWTGIYGGVHLGNGWANNTWDHGIGALEGFLPFIGAGAGNGAVGGGQVGANFQIGAWVFGAELALGATDINALSACGQALFSCTMRVDGLGTAAGRFGFAFDQS